MKFTTQRKIMNTKEGTERNNLLLNSIEWHSILGYFNNRLYWLGGEHKGEFLPKGKLFSNFKYNDTYFTTARVIYVMFKGPIKLGEQIHHIDGNNLNDTIENLQLITPAEKRLNAKAPSNSKLGVKGVRKYGKKYKAEIIVNKIKNDLGLFDTIKEAKAAYDKKALQLHVKD